MKCLRLFVCFLYVCLLLLPDASVLAEASVTDPLLITEVKVKNTSSGQTDEFIELYNNGPDELELSKYYLEYFNVYNPLSTALPTKPAFLLPEHTLGSHETVVLSIHPDKVSDSLPLELSSLKDTEGQIRLLVTTPEASDSKQLIDQLSWGDNTTVLGDIIKPPSQSDHSIQRFSESDDVPTVFQDEWIKDTATPGVLLIIIPPPVAPEELEETTDTPPEIEEDKSPVEEEVPAPVTPPVVLLPLQITELLPNPLAPQTDTVDEFVEIYNPNPEAIDLTGYTIQTGTSYSYQHELDDVTIEPNGYLSFFSGDTELALANSGGQARLLGPDGSTASESAAYTDAPEGQSWAYLNAAWQWTTTPTASIANIVTSPLPKTPKTTKSKAAAKKASATKTSKAKTAAAKTTSKKTGTVAAEREVFEDPEAVAIAPVHPSIVAGVGLLAVAYAAYEYRQDFANRLYQFRRYRAARTQARVKA